MLRYNLRINTVTTLKKHMLRYVNIIKKQSLTLNYIKYICTKIYNNELNPW